LPSALIVGAGVFGAALADRLVTAGWEVTLVDRFEPGDARSESGGETRLLRYSHGADGFYSASA
jgi:sarcosine oxidase